MNDDDVFVCTGMKLEVMRYLSLFWPPLLLKAPQRLHLPCGKGFYIYGLPFPTQRTGFG